MVIVRDFPLVELRRYRLHPGQRETLIELFEREFIESQDALGMKVIGIFRDLDKPDAFVWLRGFSDMRTRLVGLSAFYDGPVWAAHRDTAVATMIDSNDVLLLRAPSPGATFTSDGPAATHRIEPGLLIATIVTLNTAVENVLMLFKTSVAPRLRDAGVPILAWFIPEPAVNDFPRLSVRQGAPVLVWFTRFADPDTHAAHRAAIEDSMHPLLPLMVSEPEVLRLEPTSRSELR